MSSKLNFNIDLLEDIDNEGEFSLSKQLYKSKSMKEEYIENNLFVDLDLPSGTLWCKYNLGIDPYKVSNPENTVPTDWYGNYYAWGEIEPNKSWYQWYNYKHCKKGSLKLHKYCAHSIHGYKNFTDGLTRLLPEDDAAYLMNIEWKTPSLDNCKELIDNVTYTFVKNYLDVDGLDGPLLTSKINGNQLFIPAAGYFEYTATDLVNLGAFVWTCDLTGESTKAYEMRFFSNKHIKPMYWSDRYIGLNIRPIMNK